jgi:hypothetical protein
VFDLITIAAVIGLVLALRRRESELQHGGEERRRESGGLHRRRAWMLAAWLVAIWVVDSRAGFTFAMVPLAILAASALPSRATEWLPPGSVRPLVHVRRHVLAAVGTIAVLVGLAFGNYLSGLRPSSPTFALGADQTQAMRWVDESTPSDAVFVVVAGGNSWEIDAASEWFPALAERRSAGTVQGHEWLGTAAWQGQQDAYNSLQSCAIDVLPCIADWADRYEQPVTHVFLPKGQLHGPSSPTDCCPAPRHSVDLVPGARVVYDGPGATVIELP